MKKKTDNKSCFDYAGAVDLSRALSIDEEEISTDEEEEERIPTPTKRKRGPKKNITKKKHKSEHDEYLEKYLPKNKKKKDLTINNNNNNNHKTLNHKSSSVISLSDEDEDELDKLLDDDDDVVPVTNVNTQIEKTKLLSFLSKTQRVLEETKNPKLPNLNTPPVSVNRDTVRINMNCKSLSNTATFSFSFSDTFDKILEVYCNSQNINPEDVTLKFDGIPLKMDETPREYFMQDGDVIHVDYTNNGTVNVNQRAQVKDDLIITLIVRSSTAKKKFKIKKTDKFEKLFYGYCRNLNVDLQSAKFEFDGLPLDPTSTPEVEDMEDDDIIDVVVK